MLPYATLIKLDKALDIPLYRQISNCITENIQLGIIKHGTFLPSSRELSAMLSLHRNTIIAAYEELAAQDWVEILPRKGIMVSADLPVMKPRSFKAPEKSPAYQRDAPFAFGTSAPDISLGKMPPR